jgi:hypothetical protein
MRAVSFNRFQTSVIFFESEAADKLSLKEEKGFIRFKYTTPRRIPQPVLLPLRKY